MKAGDNDLTHQHAGDPIGERIVVSGRVLDENGRPVRHSLVEIWQANAAGRYPHKNDKHDAPLDPNFHRRRPHDDRRHGRYQFLTIKPGAYPWGNHFNAWRPAHIHFSLFGNAFAQRLVTQMYFPGDPLLPFDPMLPASRTKARASRLVVHLRLGKHHAGLRARLPLRHHPARPRCHADGEIAMSLQMSASQTIGPFLHIGTDWLITTELAGAGVRGERIVIEGRVYDGNGAPVTDALVELWQADAARQLRQPDDAQPAAGPGSAASAACRPTAPATSASAPSCRAACRGRATRCRRRISR